MKKHLEELAVSLASAWKTQIACPLELRPETRAQAYAVQDRFFELTGERAIGWKVGAAVPALQLELGHDGPIPGRMPEAHFYHSPAIIDYSGLPGSQAECEFAFRVNRDFLPGQAYSETQIAAGLILLPAIEIAQFRTIPSEERPRHTYDEIADNGGAAGFVVGSEMENWAGLDFDNIRIVSRIDGAEPAIQHTGVRWRHPLDVAVEMIASIGRRGHKIEAGQYLSTGSSTVPQKLAPGQTLVAEFGVLGTIEVKVR